MRSATNAKSGVRLPGGPPDLRGEVPTRFLSVHGKFPYPRKFNRLLVELADAPDSKPGPFGGIGSSPMRATSLNRVDPNPSKRVERGVAKGASYIFARVAEWHTQGT